MWQRRVPPLLVAVVSVATGVALSSAGSCGNDTVFGVGGAGGAPLPIPNIVVFSPRNLACIAVSESEDDPVIPVILDVTNIDLRPPGVCNNAFFAVSSSIASSGSGGVGGIGGAPPLLDQCGHLELTVNGELNNQGAGAQIDILLGRLANRYTTLDVTITFVREERFAFDIIDAGGPLTRNFKLTTKPSCDGEDTTTGTTTSAGSGSEGGIGGHGGASGSGMGGLGGHGG